eukprot:Lithocolla_globosa_v1_NODE_7968_length_880_cov_36.349091.p1 type:complete len:201 gc:universal NODE_7968_length_880_cov_36.349091:73-675(+)
MTEKTILTLGDSLTEGYCNYGLTFCPYGNHLQKLVHPLGYSVDIEGVSGEVTCQFLPRLEKRLEMQTKNGTFYDMVVVLGGTNDLGTGQGASVANNLNKITANIHRHSKETRIILMTVPEAGFNVSDYISDRKEINQAIKQLAAKSKNVFLFDLESSLRHSEFVPENEKYWEADRLHMSAKGYERLAQLLFDFLGASNLL